MTQPYDSAPETKAHIESVRRRIAEVMANLTQRAIAHDASKLEAPEKAMFDEYTPRLRALTYGSPEYESVRQEMLQTALAHHYAHNSHHPEHYTDGVNGMSLLDVLEMLCDWRAAIERHADGDMMKSLEFNRGRFGISDQLYAILVNTVRELGW